MYPRTIDNGHGEVLTFIGRDGDRLLVESTTAPGAGPPMHVHHLQTESMHVASGRVGYAIAGEPERFAGPGETVSFGPGVEHRFWNAGSEPLHMTGAVFPADNLEYFLAAIFASTASSRRARPDAFDAAFLLTRYRTEFALTAIPAPVRRFVMPLQARIGRILRRYDKFSDAPDPVVPRAGAKLARRSASSARSSAG
jgi:quercetin dioxygenase-like cupin family protein